MSRTEPKEASFPKTRWSLILEAQESNPEALADLCRQYWHPLYVYARRTGASSADAEDLTQSFFITILSRELFQKAAPGQGLLRSLLLRSFKNFRVSEWRKATAKKRGGEVAMIEIDAASAEAMLASEPVDCVSPEIEFERQWAREILKQAKERLLETYQAAGKKSEFEVFVEQLDDGKSERSYREIAKELGVKEPAARFIGFKFRQRYRELLEEIVSETVATREEAQEELQHLLTVFQS